MPCLVPWVRNDLGLEHTVSIWPSSRLVSLVTLTVKAKASTHPREAEITLWDTSKQGCARHSLSQELLQPFILLGFKFP